MPTLKWAITALIASGLMLLSASLASAEELKIPPLPPAYRYGNIILDKNSTKNTRKPVVFSHWVHRRKFACRDCHTDLGFIMEKGLTDITEAENRARRYCGACHNFRVSFTVRGNCTRCHSGDLDYSRPRFGDLDDLPRSGFADVIDWVSAERDRLVVHQSKVGERKFFEKDILLQPESSQAAPVVFSHSIHGTNLDCSSCHPEPFSFKKNGARDFSMKAMLGGKYCGNCHLKVAFPINDCKRCHRVQ